MNVYESLNPQQQEAVYHTQGPLLILAGAGSGKTRVLTHRISYLIKEEGVKPWHILAITFTNKAAGEMRERVNKIVGEGAEDIWVSTFHAACVRILRRFADRLGYDRRFTIYDSDDQKAVIKEVCKRCNIDTKTYKEKTFLSAISSAKDELITPEQYLAKAGSDFVKKRTGQVYQEYEKELKNSNAFDFDDLIIKTVELLKENADVADFYQERFQYIMVDEYQDTNTAQFQLVRLLAAKYRNLCVVGDDDQSIYKFRGANIYNILNFEKEYPDAKVIKLEQNYRSTQNILNVANSVIAHNQGRKVKSLWTSNEKGDPVTFIQYESEYEEADAVVRMIRCAVREQRISYSDSAILYRTNAQSRVLEEKFILTGIPYHIIGGQNFYARKEVKDLLCYLKVIDNGQDDLAVRRILNVPKRGIGTTSLQKVEDYAQLHEMSLFDALVKAREIPSLGRAAGKMADFAEMILTFRSKIESETLTELFQDILDETGYLKELEKEGTQEAQGRIENIDELMNKIVTYEQEHEDAQLGEFLEEVSLVADIDDLGEEEDRVVLMTLHSAKGLEFPYVYMTGMEEGLFPSYMALVSEESEALEEERRLCYVGITRAQKHLTLTAAKRRMVHGNIQYNPVSRFISEMDQDFLQVESPVNDFSHKTETFAQKKQSGTGSQILKGKDFFKTQASTPYPTLYGGKMSEGKKGTSGKGLERLDYQEGDRVRHIKFGEGTVQKITKIEGDYQVSVDFDKFGVKNLRASYAKLLRVE